MTTRVRIRSLPQFIHAVTTIRDQWTSTLYEFSNEDDEHEFAEPWFRGQSNSSWNLAPSIYRLQLAEEENEIRADFIRRAAQLTTERVPTTDWGWYFLMQHYRCPTRLLDWTDSALVALFFAINSNGPENREVKTDAAVWMLDPWWLNGVVLNNASLMLSDWEPVAPWLPPPYEEITLRERYPIAIDPPHVAPRVAAQRSRFTIHGTEPQGLEAIGRHKNARLVRIRIPKTVIDTIRVDLSTCGITDATVFPDLEGLSRDLIRYWKRYWWDYAEAPRLHLPP